MSFKVEFAIAEYDEVTSFDSKYGIIDFFPKANKLLIRNQNKWKRPALKFIVRNILNGG